MFIMSLDVEYRQLTNENDDDDDLQEMPTPVNFSRRRYFQALCSSKWLMLLFISIIYLTYFLLTGSVLPNINSSKSLISISQKLPKRVQLSERETLALVEEESNLAALYWLDWSENQTQWTSNSNRDMSRVTKCHQVKMISPHLVSQSNIYWQVMEIPDKLKPYSVYIYNAYYDNRVNDHVVRLITSTQQQVSVENSSFGCLFWFDGLSKPLLTTTVEIYAIWPEYWSFGFKDGLWGTVLITCPIPEAYSNQIPRAISLLPDAKCVQPSNAVRVIYNRKALSNTTQRSIGVCVKSFRFKTYDFSVRLVEWLELIRLMGAEKVYFYVFGATDSIYQVLHYYQYVEEWIEWRHITLPGLQPNIESLYQFNRDHFGGRYLPQELLELNDCLYRNIHRHDIVAILDIDELIVPQNTYNWHQLLDQVEANMETKELTQFGYYLNFHSYVYEQVAESIYDDGTPIPEYLYMQSHTYRSETWRNSSNIKCFHRTALVSAVHNHFPMRCLNSSKMHHSCKGRNLDPETESVMMHFRRWREVPNCTQCLVHDRTLWRYRDTVVKNVYQILQKIFWQN